MAREWIAWSKGFAKKPEVLQLAADFGVSRQHAAACCMEVWEWFDENTTDGHAPSVTRYLLDDIAGRPGFTDAMIRVGWLVLDGEKLSIPKFDRWNSQTSKARLLGTLRKQKQRTAAGQVSRNGHAPTVTKQGTKARPEVEVEREVTTTALPAGKPPDPETTRSVSKPPPKPRPPHWSEPYGSRLASLSGAPKGGPWPFLAQLARKHTQNAVLAALRRGDEVGYANWGHATGWLTEASRRELGRGSNPDREVSEQYRSDPQEYADHWSKQA